MARRSFLRAASGHPPFLMRLSREQRAALFEGEALPKITFPGAEPCPVAAGHVETLSAQVRLEVTAIRRTRKGDHVLVYTLYNNRIGQRFLPAQDGQLHPEQYAHSGGSAIDPEAGEAVDEVTQARITKQAQSAEWEAVQDLLAVAEEMRAMLADRMERHPQRKLAGKSIWQLRFELDRMIRNVRAREAA